MGEGCSLLNLINGRFEYLFDESLQFILVTVEFFLCCGLVIIEPCENLIAFQFDFLLVCYRDHALQLQSKLFVLY